MRNLAHLAARLYGVPLMLLPSAADVFGNTFQHILEGKGAQPGAEAEQGEPLKPQGFAANIQTSRFADKPYVVTDQGVGVLGIYGALVQRYAFDMASCTSMASYQVIKQKLELMQADPDVKAILLEFDSPGGEVAGNFDLARQMLASRGNKPVWAHANEGAYSAAYSLAAAADRIAVPQAGSVGSIGVVMVHVDQSQRDQRMGMAYTFIYAGARKVDFNSHAPLGRKAQELATAEVMRLYDMFTGHVASARSMDQQAVIDTEAGVFPANEAKQLGLVDAVASFDETLQELTDYVAQKAPSGFATAGGLAAQHNHGGTEMSTTTGAAPTTTAATPPAPTGVPEAEVQQREATARADATKAERTRVGAILNHEAAAQRPNLAKKLAFETDMSAEAAVALLGAAGVETAPAAVATAPAASPLAAAMATVPNPPVGPSAAAAAGGDDEVSTAAKVVALFNQARGVK